MYFTEAKKIIKDYVETLNFLQDSTGNIAYDESHLKNSKRAIILAFKVYMANIAVFRYLTNDECAELLKTLNRLDSFVTKEEAEYYNRIHKILINKKVDLISEEDYNIIYTSNFLLKRRFFVKSMMMLLMC